MTTLVRYEGDLFLTNLGNRNGQSLLVTYIQEKAEKHGFEKVRFGLFHKWVDSKEYEVITNSLERELDVYYVKYQHDYFKVKEESEKEILIFTLFPEIGEKYGFTPPKRMDTEYEKWVLRSETLPIDKINENLASYKGIVFSIIDENTRECLLTSNLDSYYAPWAIDRITKEPNEEGWEKKGDIWQKWISRDKIYIYGQEEFPPRL